VAPDWAARGLLPCAATKCSDSSYTDISSLHWQQQLQQQEEEERV